MQLRKTLTKYGNIGVICVQFVSQKLTRTLLFPHPPHQSTLNKNYTTTPVATPTSTRPSTFNTNFSCNDPKEGWPKISRYQKKLPKYSLFFSTSSYDTISILCYSLACMIWCIYHFETLILYGITLCIPPLPGFTLSVEAIVTQFLQSIRGNKAQAKHLQQWDAILKTVVSAQIAGSVDVVADHLSKECLLLKNRPTNSRPLMGVPKHCSSFFLWYCSQPPILFHRY